MTTATKCHFAVDAALAVAGLKKTYEIFECVSPDHGTTTTSSSFREAMAKKGPNCCHGSLLHQSCSYHHALLWFYGG